MTAVATRRAAQERGARAFATGFAIDLAVAVAVVLLAWLPDADIADKTAWTILGTAVAKSVLQAVGAYVLRLKLQPAAEVDGAFQITDVE